MIGATTANALFGFHQSPSPKGKGDSGSFAKNPGHPLRNVFQRFEIVGAVLLSYAPAVIADFIQSFHDGRPIIVAFAERRAKTFPQSFGVASLAAEFLDMKLLNPLAQNANPLLRPAVVENISDVEMPANRRAV